MSKKGLAPIIIVVIIAIIVVGGYALIKNKQHEEVTTTTTSTLTTSTSLLTVITPKSREKLEVNKNVEIQWQYKGEIVGNESGYVINLFKGEEKMRRISDFLNFNSRQDKYLWTIPSDIVDGNDYKICIEYWDYPGTDSPYGPSIKIIDHGCSNIFTISSPNKTILNVISPSENEELKIGEPYNIQWSSNNILSDDNIEIWLIYTVNKTNGEKVQLKEVVFFPSLIEIYPERLGIQHQANKSIYNWTPDIYQAWPILCSDCELILKQGSIDPNDFQIQISYTIYPGEDKRVLTYANSNKFSIIPSVSKYCLDWDFFKDPKNYDDGQPHEEIKIIQEKLGVTPIGGHYGPLTKAAVDKFNEEQKIMVLPEYVGEAFSPGIIGWTISKFNDLYCSLPKPKVTITLINYPPSPSNIDIETPDSIGVYTYIISNFEDFTHRIKIEPSETNVTTKTIEVPYSGSITIYPSLPRTLSVYDNNILVFKKGENGNIDYDLTTSIYRPYNNIAYGYTGRSDFTWNGIKEDHDIKFEFAK